MSDENPKKEKKRIWDKLLMGAVIGGAIGSVLGASIAPKKGSETRQEIKETAIKAGKKGRTFWMKIIGFIRKEKGKKIPLEREE